MRARFRAFRFSPHQFACSHVRANRHPYLSGMESIGNNGRPDGMTRVLGIETSCDETAAAVVARDKDDTPRILSNIVLSQIDAHAAFGRWGPEIGGRAYEEAADG